MDDNSKRASNAIDDAMFIAINSIAIAFCLLFAGVTTYKAGHASGRRSMSVDIYEANSGYVWTRTADDGYVVHRTNASEVGRISDQYHRPNPECPVCRKLIEPIQTGAVDAE